MSRPPLDRRNLATVSQESWRPAPFDLPGEKPIRERVRRLMDLQAASIWRDLSAQLPQIRGDALDVGCGAQPYRRLFDPSVRYVGIDHAEARVHFGYDQTDTTYFTGDRWPVDDASQDLVMATETMEHVADPRQFLAEARRALRSGGRLLLTVPFSARWHFIPHDYWRYSPSCLAMLLRDAGFTDIGIFARGNALTVACYKTIALFLPLLLPQSSSMLRRMLLRLAGMPFIPIVLLLALIGRWSLRSRGGDDCLGYTVLADRC